MTAPSKNWTDIADTSIAADKPLSTTLMTQIRDDLAFLKDWMGGAYAANAANPHTHDGVNSAFTASVADGSITTSKIVDANVTLAKLKMATGSYSTSTNGTFVIAVAQYCHIPHITVAGYLDGPASVSCNSGGHTTTGTYREITLTYGATSTSPAVTVYWNYHTN